jgi:hypothetical protein
MMPSRVFVRTNDRGSAFRCDAHRSMVRSSWWVEEKLALDTPSRVVRRHGSVGAAEALMGEASWTARADFAASGTRTER